MPHFEKLNFIGNSRAIEPLEQLPALFCSTRRRKNSKWLTMARELINNAHSTSRHRFFVVFFKPFRVNHEPTNRKDHFSGTFCSDVLVLIDVSPDRMYKQIRYDR